MNLEAIIDAHRCRACNETFTVIIRDGEREVCRGKGQTLSEALEKAEGIAKHHSIHDKRIEVRKE